ncbi:hypothetical protein FIU87_19320 [Bacillus sp. THAF10]|nr:hypothetical protein FIU87_19320 [Bacillus sp. THAF10]
MFYTLRSVSRPVSTVLSFLKSSDGIQDEIVDFGWGVFHLRDKGPVRDY